MRIRAARGFLRWSARDLAECSGVSYAAIQRAEAVDGLPNMQSKNLEAVRSALETAGVEFTNGDQPGVRLRKSQ